MAVAAKSESMSCETVLLNCDRSLRFRGLKYPRSHQRERYCRPSLENRGKANLMCALYADIFVGATGTTMSPEEDRELIEIASWLVEVDQCGKSTLTAKSGGKSGKRPRQTLQLREPAGWGPRLQHNKTFFG